MRPLCRGLPKRGLELLDEGYETKFWNLSDFYACHLMGLISGIYLIVSTKI